MNHRYISAAEVTPHDTNTIDATRGIYVGKTGDLTVQFLDGSQITLTNVPDGTFFDGFCVVKVLDTGTTADEIIALY